MVEIKAWRDEDDWPDADGDFLVQSSEGGVTERWWFWLSDYDNDPKRTEAAAQAFIDRLNGTDRPVLPEGVEVTYTLRAGVPSPIEGWEYLDIGGKWRPCAGADHPRDRTIRPVVPAPEPERVAMHEIGGRTIPGHASALKGMTWGGSGWVGKDVDGKVYPLDVCCDGMVAVLPEDNG